MMSEPSRRISACSRPTALVAPSSERNELEQTSSASPPVLWAGVMRAGRISCNTAGTPHWASCHAASQPAWPAPTTWTGRVIARNMSASGGRNQAADAIVAPSAALGAPGDGRDFRPADADIGQLAITKLGEFAQAALVIAPPAIGADQFGEQHGLS